MFHGSTFYDGIIPKKIRLATIRYLFIISPGATMSYLNKLQSNLTNYFTGARREERSIIFFIRGLIVVCILKVLILWSVSSTLFAFYKPAAPPSILARLLFLPSLVAHHHIEWLFIVLFILLITLLFLEPSYLTNLLFFWIVLNVFKIKHPVTNGSDYVLLVMSLYVIPMSFRNFKNAYFDVLNISIFNFFRLLAQIQIALIYLISAWDKLLSDVWRSGKAFNYIGHLETIINPVFRGIANDKSAAFFLSWATIIFELAFVILIWQKRTRVFILCVGVIFHLIIWPMLSLPDFALTMIVTYILFLKDSDYEIIGRLKLRPR
jgi:hypothetical protein